jgi:hypothetical protein
VVPPWRRYRIAGIVAALLLLGVGAAYVSYRRLARDGAETARPAPGPPATEVPAGTLNLRGRIRPVQPGYSAGMARGGSGTICCLVREPGGNAVYVLSADHVFAGKPGDAVLQPSGIDGGRSADRIALLSRKTPLRDDGPNVAAGAIARLDPGVQYSQVVPGIGPIRGVADSVKPGDLLRAVSRTSQFAAATVLKTGSRVELALDSSGRPVPFEGLIETSQFSEGGDSGAPVLTSGNRLVGIVFAGSPRASIVMPIQPVLKALGVELVPPP